jgi:hypothetical protein
VPLGDRAARISLLNHSMEEVKKGFHRRQERQFRSYDLAFKIFKTSPSLKLLVNGLMRITRLINLFLRDEIHQRTVKNEIDLAEKKILLGQTNSIAAKLS